MPNVHPDWKPVSEGGIGRPKPAVRRRGRKFATRDEWAAIQAAKGGLCRVCLTPDHVQLHHIVPRSLGGDDVADNIAPLCGECHAAIHSRRPLECRELAECLSDAEYAYVIGKLGEGGLERLFGVYRRETGERGCSTK